MSELGLDLDKLPVGKLSLDKIQRGHQILCEIQRHLVTGDRPQMIIPLSNDFYCAIPHNFGMKKPPILDHLLRVKEKTRMLEQVQDIITTQHVYLNALSYDLRNNNPLDVLHQELCIKLTKLERDDGLFKIIYKSIENTQADFHK